MNLFILNFDSKSFEPCKHNISLIQHAVRSTDCYVRYVSNVSKHIIIEYLKMKLSSMQIKITHWTFDSRNTVHNNLCDQPVKYSSSYIDCVMDFNAHIYLLW